MECLNYPIYFKEGFDSLTDAFACAGLKGKRACIITDQNVSALYLNEIQDKISAKAFEFTPGEASKNLDVIRRIYEFFLDARMDRGSVAVALGGGVAGDIAGFAAATFMRGITLVQIPTTLLSQADSSVGGKTGVDMGGHKNLIGAFYQPAFVYINISALDTLAPDQFSSGIAEVIKAALIADPEFFEILLKEKEHIRKREKTALLDVVKRTVQIKASVVNKDEKEKGVREILNFGHTFGHALESISHFNLLHGHCVALGIMAALYLSQKYGGINNNLLYSVRQLFEYFNLPTKIKGLHPQDIFDQMLFDKKNRGGRIRLVLLESPGNAIINQTADEDSIMEAIRSIIG